MPCDTVRMTTVELERVPAATLAGALKQAGLERVQLYQGQALRLANGSYVQARIVGGTLSTTGSQEQTLEVAGMVKRAVTSYAVAQTAKQFGWRVNATTPNTLKLKR